VKRSQDVDFIWYGLAVIVACIAMISEIFKVTGPFSGPMLWGLFGIATGRILGKQRSASKQTLRYHEHEIEDASTKILRMPNVAAQPLQEQDKHKI